MWVILLFLITTTTAISTTPISSTISSTVIYDSLLGYACDSDTNCAGLVGNSMCLDGICVCQPGYVPEGIWHCFEGEGMTNLSVTYKLILIVTDTTTSTSATTSYLIHDSVLGGACELDTNCQGLVGSSMCLDGTCVCQPGFFAEGVLYCIHLEGMKNLSVTYTLILLVTDTTTSTSVTTSYLIYDSVLGGRCDSDMNCGGLVYNAICLDGMCACSPGYVPQGDMNCVEGEGMTNLSVSSLIMKYELLSLVIATSSSTRTTTIVRGGSLLGGSCFSNANCQSRVLHSMCCNEKCACRHGYIRKGKKQCKRKKRYG